MSTSSRRLSARARTARPSQTPGKLKADSCQRSELKDFGRTANPAKLSVASLYRYNEYCAHVDRLNLGGKAG